MEGGIPEGCDGGGSLPRWGNVERGRIEKEVCFCAGLDSACGKGLSDVFLQIEVHVRSWRAVNAGTRFDAIF